MADQEVLPGYIVHSRTVQFQGDPNGLDKKVCLITEEVTRPNGVRGPWTYLDAKGEVPVFMVVVKESEPSRRVLLVAHDRFPTRVPGSLEIPAGWPEAGENARQTVLRETKEETGLIVTKAEELAGPWQAANGITNERIQVWLITGAKQSGENKHAEEGITGQGMYTFAEIRQLIQNGKLTDTLTIAAVLYAGLVLGELKL